MLPAVVVSASVVVSAAVSPEAVDASMVVPGVVVGFSTQALFEHSCVLLQWLSSLQVHCPAMHMNAHGGLPLQTQAPLASQSSDLSVSHGCLHLSEIHPLLVTHFLPAGHGLVSGEQTQVLVRGKHISSFGHSASFVHA